MKIFEDWNSIVENHISSIQKFISTNTQLYKDYIEKVNNRTKIGFNAFTLTSDFYYRENFHSFIIKAFLDPKEKHNEGYKYLHLFIELLNKVNNKNKISTKHFKY